MNTKEEISKENKFIAPILVIGGTLLLTTITYATWSIVHAASSTNIVQSGCFESIFEEGSNNINLIGVGSITDSEGLKTTPYTFSVQNTCSTNSTYEVLMEIENTNIDLSKVKISINNKEPILLSDLENRELKNDNIIETKKIEFGNLSVGAVDSYAIKLWIDESAHITNDENINLNSKIIINNYKNN